VPHPRGAADVNLGDPCARRKRAGGIFVHASAREYDDAAPCPLRVPLQGRAPGRPQSVARTCQDAIDPRVAAQDAQRSLRIGQRVERAMERRAGSRRGFEDAPQRLLIDVTVANPADDDAVDAERVERGCGVDEYASLILGPARESVRLAHHDAQRQRHLPPDLADEIDRRGETVAREIADDLETIRAAPCRLDRVLDGRRDDFEDERCYLASLYADFAAAGMPFARGHDGCAAVSSV